MNGPLIPQATFGPVRPLAPRDDDLEIRAAAAGVSVEAALAAHAFSLRAAMRGLLQADGVGVSEREVKLLLARLSDAMLEGVAICDGAHRIVYVNPHVCRLLG